MVAIVFYMEGALERDSMLPVSSLSLGRGVEVWGDGEWGRWGVRRPGC